MTRRHLLRTLSLTLSVLLVSAGLLVAAPPVEAAVRPIQPYSWWQGLGAGHWNLDQRLTVNAYDPPTTTLFWAHQVGFVGDNDGGYLGLQVLGSTRLAPFSLWGATAARGNQCNPFEEDGAGWSCRITGYDWQPNRTYRLRIWAQETSGTGRWWGGWVQDPTTGVDSHVGALFVPYLTLMESRVSWTEYLGADLSTCDAAPRAKALWELPTADNGAVRSTGAVNALGSGSGCPTAARVASVPSGTVQEMGTTPIYTGCTATSGEHMVVSPGADPAAGEKVVEIAGASPASGGANQRWWHDYRGKDTYGRDYWVLVNKQDLRCLDIEGLGWASGTPVQVWSCYGGWNQLFAYQ